MATQKHETPAAEQLRIATEVVESVVRGRGLVRSVAEEERTRLLSAAGDVFNPDVIARGRADKDNRKRGKAAKLDRDESVLAETGIRVLRDRPVFTTPNVYPPAGFEEAGLAPDAELREAIEPQHCYVCKQLYREIHQFYDQMCLPCGDFNFAKRAETADLHGRVALLTGGRVKIGFQAGVKLPPPRARRLVTTRLPPAPPPRHASEPAFGA